MSIGITPQGFPPPAPPPPPPSGSGAKIPILFGIVIALVAANVYLFVQLNNVHSDMAKMRDSLLDEITKVREAHTLSTQTSRHTIDELRDQLQAQRRQLSMASARRERMLRARCRRPRIVSALLRPNRPRRSNLR
jgi:hypothetical protein